MSLILSPPIFCFLLSTLQSNDRTKRLLVLSSQSISNRVKGIVSILCGLSLFPCILFFICSPWSSHCRTSEALFSPKGSFDPHVDGLSCNRLTNQLRVLIRSCTTCAFPKTNVLQHFIQTHSDLKLLTFKPRKINDQFLLCHSKWNSLLVISLSPSL